MPRAASSDSTPLPAAAESQREGTEPCPVERPDGRLEADLLAREEPLEIRLGSDPLAVTMRTPGHDEELAAGFLFTEGVLQHRSEIASIAPCDLPVHGDLDSRIRVHLYEAPQLSKVRSASRKFRAVSACGLCGKSTLEDIRQMLPSIRETTCDLDLLQGLPDKMRDAQHLFSATGGIHAAALFDMEGRLLCLREDIGRHNAVDKIVGWALFADALPLEDRILVVSGRAGFEIVQKAMMASIPVLASVGAASNIAARLATEGGLSLYSFVGPGRGNRHLSTR